MTAAALIHYLRSRRRAAARGAAVAAAPPAGRRYRRRQRSRTLVVLSSTSPSQTEQAGFRIGLALLPGAVLSLEGPLGSGKTVLVRGIARALGIEEPVTSPTFTLVSHYRVPGPGAGRPADLYHVDLYRLDGETEIEELGLDELMGGRGVVAVEWGEKAARFLPADAVRVRIAITGSGGREIRIEGLAP